MALPYSFLDGGTFQLSVTGSPGVAAAVNVQVMGNPDFIVARAVTGWGRASNASSIEWRWNTTMGNGFANGILQSSNASAPAMISYKLPFTGTAATDAIWVYNTTNPPTFAGLATTAITGSSGSSHTFVCTMASTGTIAVGDYVRLVNTTGELQIAGYSFQVTAVTKDTSITLGYMASSGIAFAADATAGTVIKFIPNRFYPRKRFIANITQGATTTVYFTAQNDFTPGENVAFRVSSDYGMQEINYKVGRVLSVTNSATVSSIVVNIDSSGYTAFSFPTSATAAAGVTPAMVVPSSSGVVPYNGSATVPQQPPGTNLQDAFDNRNVNLIHFGASLFNIASYVSTNNDVWEWEAYKCDNFSALGTV